VCVLRDTLDYPAFICIGVATLMPRKRRALLSAEESEASAQAGAGVGRRRRGKADRRSAGARFSAWPELLPLVLVDGGRSSRPRRTIKVARPAHLGFEGSSFPALSPSPSVLNPVELCRRLLLSQPRRAPPSPCSAASCSSPAQNYIFV
jgi:hypothetical protein